MDKQCTCTKHRLQAVLEKDGQTFASAKLARYPQKMVNTIAHQVVAALQRPESRVHLPVNWTPATTEHMWPHGLQAAVRKCYPAGEAQL